MARLAKLAAISAALRGIEKTALLGSALGAVAKGAGKYALKNPVMTGVGGLVAVGGAKGASQKYKQYKGGFDPQASQALQGQTPIPPGVG